MFQKQQSKWRRTRLQRIKLVVEIYTRFESKGELPLRHNGPPNAIDPSRHSTLCNPSCSIKHY
jgi:hypothetical protein